MAKFTVVTACRNAVRYIEETVKSVLSQSIFLSGQCELEHLVYDGASTDGTLNLLRPYERHGVNVNSEPRSGLYASLATGLHPLSDDHIRCLHSGDMNLP